MKCSVCATKGTAALISAIVCVLVFVLPAAAQIKWNLPGAFPTDNPHSENLVLFAKDVANATGGKLQLTVHANASLFKAPEIKRAVQTGQVQMGEINISIHENEDPMFGLDVVPFLATSFEQAKKLWDAQRPFVEKKLGSQGIKVLYAVPWGPQGLYVKKDLRTTEEMKGLKWRAYSVGTARIGELIGAQAVTIQAAELPQALATGVVNAFMSSSGTGYDSKVWESLTHFYDTRAWLNKNVTVVNVAAFEALDKPTQEAILKAASAAEARGWKMWQDKNSWYIEQLKAKGLKVLSPGPELAAGFQRIGEKLTADWLKKAGPDGQAVLAAYRKSIVAK